MAASGDLVLGDFGIVFLQPGQGERLTSTYGERVGSHFWMAPWAYNNVRLNFGEVRPTLDIYPLGKVLWSMISGRNGFAFWEYNREDNDLKKMFPDDPIMPLVNTLLAKCVVREERDCLSTAQELLSEVDGLIKQIKAWRGHRPDNAETWPCRICGKGAYRPAPLPAGTTAASNLPGHFPRPLILAQISGREVSDRQPFSIFVCDHCGHAELFKAYT